MRSLFRRITSRLTICQQIGGVFCLGILTLAALAAVFIAQGAEKRIEQRLLAQAHSLVTSLASTVSYSSSPHDDGYGYVLPIASLPSVGGVAIYSPEGNVLFQRGAQIPTPPANLSLTLEDQDYWYFFQGVGKDAGSAAIAFEKSALEENSSGILLSNLITALAAALVMIILVLFVSGRIVGPLRALSAAMDRARKGERNVRAELAGSRELQAMGQAFNTMMSELDARQEQLQRSRDIALASARTKGEFASILSHELRTPMNGVMGMLELLNSSELNQEQREYVSIAHSSGQQLLRLIDEVLHLARTGASRQSLNIGDYQPRTLIEEVCKLLRHKAQQKDIHLKWEVDPAVPDCLQGDAGKIRQVLINLVGNAIKFTDRGEVSIAASMDGSQLAIAVTDTGRGIPEAAQEQIFEPYVQLQASKDQETDGSGLGLSICSGLVKAMGGALELHSEVGKGSCFRFVVPSQQTAAVPAKMDDGIEESTYVLVVDDDRSSRMLMTAILKKDGYRVAEAADGAEAVDLCRKSMPNVILMDAVMPNMDGFTACQKIRAMDSPHPPQILMITGLQDDETLERALAVGANDFINKPVNATALRQRVGRLLHVQKVDSHLHQLSNFDQLTGLPNRALFVEQAHRLLMEADANNNELAILFIDLDRFKVINETRGHEFGDMLLQRFAARLQETMRSRDVISRLSGDIFTVLLNQVRGVDGAIAAANKVLEIARQPLGKNEQPSFLSASIGISLYPKNARTVSALMQQADAAMYRAKSRGGNAFEFYQEGMELAISQEIELEIDLRNALERDEFVLHYQPQVCASTGNLMGLEALVRWQHPRRGLLQPGDFIPLAEKTGLIAQIDEWVMMEACRQLRHWLDQGMKPVPVAVNVSGGQLADSSLFSKVEHSLQESRIPANLLKLEITEDTLASSSAETTALLQRLRSLGVTLAIDDFGTGYSSLSYLKAFPVDTLKIDRSFINDLPNDSSSAAIVSGIIALGHNLQLTIVAEGAETAEQHNFLKEAACDVIQGFLVSRPLPVAEVEEWIAKSTQAANTACVEESATAHH